MKSNKKLDIELMRILAAFFVVFNHTGSVGFHLFSQYDAGSFRFWLFLFIAVFAKFSIYLFLMITGALMLNREPEPLKTLWRNRVLRMTLILLAWLFFYYCVDVLKGRETFRIARFLEGSCGSGIDKWNHSLWYLYAYIPLLMSLPLLQRFAKSLANKEYLYMIGLFLAFSSLLPTAERLLWRESFRLNEHFSLGWLCTLVLFYPLLGYFLQFRARDYWNKKRLAILWGGNIAAIALNCRMVHQKITAMGTIDLIAVEPIFITFVAVNATTMFVTIQYLSDHVKFHAVIQKGICLLGGCSFGVYMLHVFFIDKTTLLLKFLHGFRDWLHMGDMLSALMATGCIFLVCCAVTTVLKQIPLIKKLV